MLLEKHWFPPEDYVFPCSGKKNRGQQTQINFDSSHLQKFGWLVLSNKIKGLYCKYCAIFNLNKDSQSKSPQKLVKAPLKAFDNLVGALEKHEQDQNHKDAVKDGDTFLENFHKSSGDISNTSDNKERLRPIIKTIIFCGHQNIPLQGNKDDKNLMEDEETPECITIDDSIVSRAEGNFRALLNFRVESGDTDLQSHLENDESNATYINERVQKKLINICEEIIQHSVLENVKKAKYFSILFDEAKDLFHNTQLCLSVKYLQNNSITEDFLTFCNINKGFTYNEALGNGEAVGVALAKVVEDICNKFEVDLKWCVGISIDNCSVMNPETKTAVVQQLIKKAVHAKRCPSSNYILNNSLSLVSCRNTTVAMRKVIQFANASHERQEIFRKELPASAQDIWKKCWDTMHDGHLLFEGENLIQICSALEWISKWNKNEIANDANFLLQILRSSDFIISSIRLSDVLGITVTLSKILQSPSSAIEFKRASEAVENANTVLLQKREQVDVHFLQLFQQAEELAKNLGVELNYPKTNTENSLLDAESAQEHYCKKIYISILDSVMEHMSPEVTDLFKLRVFLPKKEEETEESNNSDLLDVKQLASNYAPLIGNSVEKDYELWMAKWQNTETIPQALCEAIDQCDEKLYPNINLFLNILAVLPVSKISRGRSFSTLHRLKTWLRSSTAKDHLTGLALLYIHKNVKIDVENVIELFMKHQ